MGDTRSSILLHTRETDPPEVDRGSRAPWWSIARLLGLAYLVVAAVRRLSHAIPYLLWDVESWAATDLKYRYNEVAEWFAGNPVYGVVDGAVYPPGSHAILWPLLGWLSLDGARVLWAVTTLAASAGLAVVAYYACRSASSLDRLLVAGLAFASYPIQGAIYIGQLGVHVTVLIAAAAVLLFADRSDRWTDALAGFLLGCSLVKPSLSLPLAAAALVAASRPIPVVAAALSYTTFTLVAAFAQGEGLVTLLRDWLGITETRVSVMEGVPNLQMLLEWAGLGSWANPAALLVLVGMAAWMWRRERADPWVMLGLAAIVARLWMHSRVYDDAFLILAVAALCRVVNEGSGRCRRAAAWLLAAAWAALLTPTWAFYDTSATTLFMIHAAQTALWLCVGWCMVLALRRDRTNPFVEVRTAPVGARS